MSFSLDLEIVIIYYIFQRKLVGEIMNKKWECYKTDIQKRDKIIEENNISSLLATILVNKNITEKGEIQKFLNPTRNDFFDPFLMPDIKLAVPRIIKAIDNSEKVIIYGDYDVDGITSITVLKKFLADRGLAVDEYIPNRLDEGYGLNKKAIEQISGKGYSLMITVDCGISAIDEVDYAKELGIEVIITDHHEPIDELPNALAVIDAKRKDNKYPFNQLAGVGVVFKLIQAISMKLELDDKEYLKYLDIVCIGTISDIVPLISENRVITKLGLKLVAQTKNIGLKTLLNEAGYKNIDSTSISFGVAPRINACGRMGYQNEALKLFLTEDINEANEICNKLNTFNLERQQTEKNIFKEAIEMIEKSEKDKPVIVLGKENWHHGVIGIVSSKVTEQYFKPSILVCFEGEYGKGSGRSIPGFDLHDALSNCDTYLSKFGGHSMAVGVTVDKSNFNKFKEEFEEYASKCNLNEIVPILNIDNEITAKELSVTAIRELEKLEPFGEGNKKPIFLYKNLKITSIRALTEGKHLKLTLKDDNFLIDVIGFNLGYLSEEYLIGDKVDVAGTLEINSFNGNDNIQINLKDMRRSY